MLRFFVAVSLGLVGAGLIGGPRGNPPAAESTQWAPSMTQLENGDLLVLEGPALDGGGVSFWLDDLALGPVEWTSPTRARWRAQGLRGKGTQQLRALSPDGRWLAVHAIEVDGESGFQIRPSQ